MDPILTAHVREQNAFTLDAYLNQQGGYAGLRKALGMTPDEVIGAATGEAARAIGLGDSIGTLERGKSADLIVLASHKPALKDYLLGANASRVVRSAPCSVHVVRGGRADTGAPTAFA